MDSDWKWILNGGESDFNSVLPIATDTRALQQHQRGNETTISASLVFIAEIEMRYNERMN